jgi:hypothetical protein
MIKCLIQIIDFKISMLNKVKRCLTGETKTDKIYKSEKTKKDIKEWVKNK